MIRTLRTAAIATILSVYAVAALAAPETGKTAPDFSVTDIAGAPHSLAQYKGKVVVLEWHNPGCPFVKKHYDSGNMQKLQAYAKEKGAVWLAVNSGAKGKQGHLTAEEAKAMLAQAKAAPAGYVLDLEGALGHRYDAKTTPHMFVIDKGGVLAYQGAIDDKPGVDQADIPGARNYVKDAIDALLAGTPVAVAQTKAYGCSVKY